MKKYLKITLLVIIAIILVGTFVFLYQKSKPKVIVYETLAAEVTDLEKTTVATGKVEPRDEILIKPQISGIVDEVFKEAGQSVKKGEVIAKVKVIPELGQLNSAESRVRLAEINAKQAETDFTRIKTYNYEDYPTMMGSGIHHYKDAATYYGVVGRYYYATAYCYAGDETGYDEKSYTTSIVRAKA